MLSNAHFTIGVKKPPKRPVKHPPIAAGPEAIPRVGMAATAAAPAPVTAHPISAPDKASWIGNFSFSFCSSSWTFCGTCSETFLLIWSSMYFFSSGGRSFCGVSEGDGFWEPSGQPCGQGGVGVGIGSSPGSNHQIGLRPPPPTIAGATDPASVASLTAAAWHCCFFWSSCWVVSSCLFWGCCCWFGCCCGCCPCCGCCGAFCCGAW